MAETSRSGLSVADLRREYTRIGLTEEELCADPIEQFTKWFSEVIAAESLDPNAMTLATASADGRPSARTVLLKGFDERGFVFFTNYESSKAQDLAENPWAALIFYWGELARQVRITGRASKVTREESDTYFHSRPPGSQISAAVSPQSQIIAGREVLEERVREMTEQYGESDIPLPSYWGGYRIEPDMIEFWQGRPNRLHDRLRYRKEDGAWHIERLAP